MKLWIGAALIFLGILLNAVGLNRLPLLDLGDLYVDVICMTVGIIWFVTELRKKKQ